MFEEVMIEMCEKSKSSEGVGGAVTSSMMVEEVHTYRHTYIDYIVYIKCCILQHFLAKLDVLKSDDSNRGATKSLPKI